MDMPILSRRVVYTRPEISATIDLQVVTFFFSVLMAPVRDAAIAATTEPSKVTTATDSATDVGRPDEGSEFVSIPIAETLAVSGTGVGARVPEAVGLEVFRD